MSALTVFFVFLFNIIEILLAAWLAVANVPLVLGGTAGFWNYVWLGMAIVLLVNAGAPIRSSQD